MSKYFLDQVVWLLLAAEGVDMAEESDASSAADASDIEAAAAPSEGDPDTSIIILECGQL